MSSQHPGTSPMTHSKQQVKQLLMAAIIAFCLFVNAAMAQSEAESPVPDNTETESGSMQKTDKIGSTEFLKGHIVVYRLWQSQRPFFSFEIPPDSLVLLDIVDGRTAILRQETVSKNGITLFDKLWEHDVISSKACLKTIDKSIPLQDSQCITGRKNIIQLPRDSSPFDFIYTAEWIEAGKPRMITAPLNASQKPVDKKPLNQH